jgi:hypothetical protein
VTLSAILEGSRDDKVGAPPTSTPTAAATAATPPPTGPASPPTTAPGCGKYLTSIRAVAPATIEVTVCEPPPTGYHYWVVVSTRATGDEWEHYPQFKLIAPGVGSNRLPMSHPAIADRSPSPTTCPQCPAERVAVFIAAVPDEQVPAVEKSHRTETPMAETLIHASDDYAVY